MDVAAIEKINAGVKTWTAESDKALQGMFDTLDIQHRANSPSTVAARESIKNSFGKSYGLIVRIGFKFPRHMVFVAKGVGKGTPIGKVGTTSRKAKDWFNAPMEVQVEKLADQVAEDLGEVYVRGLAIR